MSDQQTDLPLFKALEKPAVKDFGFLVQILTGKDWMTATEILTVMGLPATDSHKRSIRAIASDSEGKIAGGQKGYKLVTQMTREEYNHYRNWMKSQADDMTARILKSDKVFYRRQPVETGNGIL